MTPTEQLMSTAVAALASAVAFLFFWFKSNHEKVEKRLQDCEDDREKLWETVAVLSRNTCVTADCPLRKPVAVPKPGVQPT